METTVQNGPPEREPSNVTPEPYLTAVEAAELRILYAGNPVIDRAERELRQFGVQDGESTDAVKLLLAWTDFNLLTEREVRGVAARFVPEHDALTPEQIEMDRQANGLDDADDHFVIGQTSAGWPGAEQLDEDDEDDEDDDLVPAPGCGHPASPSVDCCVSTRAQAEPVEPERRTVGPEVMTDELRQLGTRLRPDAREEMAAAKVALVLRIGGQPVAVPDTDVPWVAGTPGEPVKALRGLLTEAIQGKNRLEREEGVPVELLMPTPDVLAALDGRPDAQLLTAPVHVLALDVDPGMYLLVGSAPRQQLVTATGPCTRPGCDEGASCVVLTVDGAEQHHGGYARTRVRIPVSVTR
jgi:hypothetical protein